jgi:hypothetical protein
VSQFNPLLNKHFQTYIDEAEIHRAIGTLKEGSPFEVRILEAEMGPIHGRKEFYGKRTMSGYFDSADTLLSALQNMALVKSKGIYITLNDIEPALFVRSCNRFQAGIQATADRDIIHRRWLFIDVDPKRPSGVSSTEEEKIKAVDLIENIRQDLRWNCGFSEPIFADSGNGYHLLYRVDLPGESNLPEIILKKLAAKWDNEFASVDVSVHNAARIIKLYGTMSQKGDSHAPSGRIHRLAKILHIPDEVETIFCETLENFVKFYEKTDTQVHQVAEDSNGSKILSGTEASQYSDLLQKHFTQFAIKEPVAYDGGTRWQLAVCPFDQSHQNSSSIFLRDGTLGFRCHHASCLEKHWLDVCIKLNLPQELRNGRSEISKEWLPMADTFFLAPLPDVPLDIWEQDFLNELVIEISAVVCCPREVVLLAVATILGFSFGSRFTIRVKEGLETRQKGFSGERRKKILNLQYASKMCGTMD